MNKFSSQIQNHQFAQEFLSDLAPYITKWNQATEDSEEKQSEFEQYSLSTFSWMIRIGDCFETLEHARAYLRYFRTNKRYKEAGIRRVNYINYHYFYCVTSVVRIMDIALILTNNTFRLGNPERLCYFENIIKNQWVRSTGTDKSLKKINSIIEPWREPRNRFVHRGEKLDRELLLRLEAYDFLIEKDKSITDISPISPSETKLWYKSEVSKIFKELEQTEIPLFNATSKLLSQLLPIYRFWRNKLKQSSEG